MESRAPSGLFPSGPQRPTYREPHPVRVGAVLAGAGVAALWLLVFGLLASSAATYAWLTLAASAVAWGCGFALMRHGDRGAAVGIGLVTGLGLAIAAGVVLENWIVEGWPLW